MTLGMDSPDDNVQLTEQNFRNVCRLCLHADEEFINVFDRIEENPLKQPLADRVYDLYQIKLVQNDGLPTKICHRCLYNTELFFEFREGVHQCERKLQDFIATLASKSNEVTATGWHLDDILNDQHESSDLRNDVVVVDPLKCYESSDEENKDDTEELGANESMLSTQSQLAPAVFNQSFLSESLKSGFEDIKPLRNVAFCKHCEAAFIHQHDCEVHENAKHDPVMPLLCRFCPYRDDNQITFIGHIKQFHDAERPYYCTQCDKHFGRRADLRKHAVSHTGIRPFSCPVCRKTFSRKTNVLSHMKVHEKASTPSRQDKSYPLLAKSLSAPAGYTPDGFQPQPYPTYPDVTAKSSAVYSKCAVKSEPNKIPKLKLKLKLSKPTASVAKFPCLTCKKSFKTKRDLVRHSQIHSSMKFQCSVCQKGFARRDKLTRHEKIHANRKKTAALPESAFRMENLKRSHLSEKPATATTIQKQPIDSFRPQYYAEYDLNEINK